MAGKGKRYSEENKLNYTKIFAVIIFFIVFIMIILGIKKILNTKTNSTGKISTINYFPVFTKYKWGVIDSNGEIVIEPQYIEKIIIPNNSKAYFICTYDVNYETGEYKTKVINEKNESVIIGYDNVNFMDYYEDNNVKYLDNLLKVEQNGKYGLVSLNGTKILECKYDEISLLKAVDNSIILKENGLEGLCDFNGKIIIEPKYKEIREIGKNYKNGYITISNDNLYGIIDFNSNIIFENKFLDIKGVYSTNKYAVKNEGNYKIIDKTEKVLLEKEFEDVLDINNNEIIYKQNGKCGVMNISGEVKIQPQYEEIEYLDTNTYIAKKNDKYGLIDLNNDDQIEYKYIKIKSIPEVGIIIAQVSNNQYEIYENETRTLKLKVNDIKVEDKYIIVKENNQIKYYDFKFEEKSAKSIFTNNTLFSDKKGNKYGFLDANSNVVTEYKYDEVTEFNEYGFAGVKLNGLWGVVGPDGKEIIAPKYNLDNNKEINFINRWHIGIDGTYYTDT